MAGSPALPPDCRPIVDPRDPRRAIPLYCVRADGTILYYRPAWRKWIPLRPKAGPGGFRKVQLRRDGRVVSMGVAQLVLRAFAGPRPIGCEPLHYPDPDPGNNHINNLRWSPRGSSKIGRLLSGSPPPVRRGSAYRRAALTEVDIPAIRDLYRGGADIPEIAERYGVADETIRHVLIGRSWAHVPDPRGPVVMRKRGPRPEESPRAKLDWPQVADIRQAMAAGVPLRVIAGYHGVSICTLNDIARGRTWREECVPSAPRKSYGTGRTS